MIAPQPRIWPLAGFGSRRARFLVERNVYVYRRTWIVFVSGFFEPLFYLGSIRFGLGSIIGTVPGPGGEPISYQLFVAPALLATASMNGAIAEATFFDPDVESDGGSTSLPAITASLGVASYRDHLAPGGTARRRESMFLKLADSAMYLAKANGRNRVELAEPED